MIYLNLMVVRLASTVGFTAPALAPALAPAPAPAPAPANSDSEFDANRREEAPKKIAASTRIRCYVGRRLALSKRMEVSEPALATAANTERDIAAAYALKTSRTIIGRFPLKP
jgi:hypothetical protein